jgi:TRAP-type transport system small permease protein
VDSSSSLAKHKTRLQTAANAVGVVLFTALLVTFIVQVTARFVFNQPLPWTDELAVVLYIAVILWACATMVNNAEHVAFDLLLNALPARIARWARAAGAVLLLVLVLVALPGSWDYIQFMQRERTPVLGLAFFWVYLPFALLLLAVALRQVALLYALFKPVDQPVQHVLQANAAAPSEVHKTGGAS